MIFKKNIIKNFSLIAILTGGIVIGSINSLTYANELDYSDKDYFKDSVIENSNERSSYNIDYSFKVNLKGTPRNFNTGTIKATLNTKCSGSSTNEFNGELWRKNSIGESFIGRQTFPLNGSRTRSWSGLNAGTYFISLVKANDGSTAKGNGVFSN